MLGAAGLFLWRPGHLENGTNREQAADSGTYSPTGVSGADLFLIVLGTALVSSSPPRLVPSWRSSPSAGGGGVHWFGRGGSLRLQGSRKRVDAG